MSLNMNMVTADEKYIRTVMIYAKKSDNYIYADPACKQKIDKDTLLNLCKKGFAIVSYEGAVYTVTAYKENSAKNCVDVTFYDALATTAAAVTVHSAEYK